MNSSPPETSVRVDNHAGAWEASGVETNWGVCQVWTMQDRTAVRGQGFPSRADALEAVGLSE